MPLPNWTEYYTVTPQGAVIRLPIFTKVHKLRLFDLHQAGNLYPSEKKAVDARVSKGYSQTPTIKRAGKCKKK